MYYLSLLKAIYRLIVNEIWVYDFTSQQRRPVFNETAYKVNINRSET